MDARATAVTVHVGAIANACWWVRHYAPARTSAMREQRARAILALGLCVRAAFMDCADCELEALLLALVDGLVPPERRF